MRIFLFILRILAAGILLQTLFFKFTAAPESVYIFSTLHADPWGRWFSGVVELVSAVLLLIPMTQALGALIGLGVMAGALLSHIFILGLVVQDDGGLLFALALVVFASCLFILVMQRQQLQRLLGHLRTSLRAQAKVERKGS